MKLNILYEDNELLVIDKPPGLVVDQSITQKDPTLADILQSDFGIKLDRGGIVHRLDKDTSGLVIVARTKEALDELQKQFKERTVKKEYMALVHGTLESEKIVDAPIDRNPKNREKFIVLEGGREAVTEFITTRNFQFSTSSFQSIFNDLSKIQRRKLEKMNYNYFTLVKCLPLTGRTHQIRVHLKHLGFPIVGDEKYGGRKVSRLDGRWCKRQFLHAAKIKFIHPKTGNPMEFESPLPKDLEDALKLLEISH